MAQGQQQPISAQGGHPVPIENYLNAQCTSDPITETLPYQASNFD